MVFARAALLGPPGLLVDAAAIAIEHQRHQTGAERSRNENSEHSCDGDIEVLLEPAQPTKAQARPSAMAIAPRQAKMNYMTHFIGASCPTSNRISTGSIAADGARFRLLPEAPGRKCAFAASES